MFDWQKDECGGYQAQMPDNVTVWVAPVDYAKGFTPKPKRWTKWRGGANHWDESSRTSSRYGRDSYMDLKNSAKEAMRLAEEIYRDATPC